MSRRFDHPRPRIGLDLTRAPADTPWWPVVREAAQLAPDLALHVCVPPAQRAAWESTARGLPVQWLDASSTGWAPWHWIRLQRRWRLDLLHREGPGPLVAGGPWSTSLHRLPKGSTPRRLASAQWVCVPSRWAQDELVSRGGLDPARVAVVPPWVDAVRFRPGTDGRALAQALGLEAGQYLCSVAACNAHKRPLALLEAYALMPRPRPTLVLIGRDGDPLHRLALEATIQRLGLSADVRLLEGVTDTQLPALLRHARLFVQASLQAQRGMAVLEAMASGVAVVTSALPVLGERVGAAGLTVNPRDPHELAAAMLCLLADPRRRQALAQRGLARAEAHHARVAAERLVEGWRAAVFGRAASPAPAWA